MKSVLRVASCQFSIEADIEQNLEAIVAQIREAAQREARIVHFPETALSGYAGVDIPDTATLDWDKLRRATETVLAEAAERKVWVMLGTTHRLTADHLPHNSVYVISDEGRIVERYDKRFCTGVCEPEDTLDLSYYTPGDHATTFEVDGHRCGVLICYDYRFPELYRDLNRRGVKVVLQSFHNARRDEAAHEADNIWKDIVPATVMCRAASNHFWISAVNSTARCSSWPSFFARPDGRITGRLLDHDPSVLISEVDPSQEIWDAAGPWRERAMNGRLHSGEPVEDPRTADRSCY